MEQWLLDNMFSIITALFGGGSFFAYITERKKRKIEEKQLTADALSKMQEAYDKFMEDSLIRYKDLREEIDDLKKKLVDVKTQLNNEKRKNSLLKNEFENYKKKHS
ncbi:hypothetical protein [Leptobacterium sp. I13]|uniref:hypothetical protein n=1 Tax=Leptobacterium meishanense TaxID=3128904 RepID=UPI0030EB5DB9